MSYRRSDGKPADRGHDVGIFGRSGIISYCLAVVTGAGIGCVVAQGSIAYARDCPGEETRFFGEPVITVLEGAGDPGVEQASWPEMVWLTPTQLSTNDHEFLFEEP